VPKYMLSSLITGAIILSSSITATSPLLSATETQSFTKNQSEGTTVFEPWISQEYTKPEIRRYLSAFYDTDNDHIFNFQDKCPLEEETKNGYNDVDGCPDLSLEQLVARGNAWTDFDELKNISSPVRATIDGPKISLTNAGDGNISAFIIKIKQDNSTALQLPASLKSNWSLEQMTDDTFMIFPKAWADKEAATKAEDMLVRPDQSIELIATWGNLSALHSNSTLTVSPSNRDETSDEILEVFALPTPPVHGPGDGGSIHPIGIRILEDYPLTPHETVSLEGSTLNLDPSQGILLFVTGPTGFPLVPYFPMPIIREADGTFSLPIDITDSPFFYMLSEQELTGTYTVFVQQGDLQASADFEIIFPQIQLHTDRPNYQPDISVTITAFVSGTSSRSTEFRMGVFPPTSDNLIYFDTLRPDAGGRASVTLPSQIFRECGQYEVMAALQYGTESFSQFFTYTINCPPGGGPALIGCHWRAGEPPPDCIGEREPEKKVRAPDGQEYPVLTNVDEDGNAIEIRYVSGVRRIIGDDEYPPACRGPTTGLYQEGVDWQVTPDTTTMGLSHKWKMPNINALTASKAGIYYNPVNFHYKGMDPGVAPFYYFFQVSFGVGNNGVANGWLMTALYLDGQMNRRYETIELRGIPIIPGTTYKVDAVLTKPPLSSVPAFEVQITPQGGRGYIKSFPLAYQPGIGTQENIEKLRTYTDQYVESEGTATSDIAAYNHTPRLKRLSGNTITEDRTGITGFSDFDDFLRRTTKYRTMDILSPSPPSTSPYYDHLDCTSWTYPP
jgi:hypothetical protein